VGGEGVTRLFQELEGCRDVLQELEKRHHVELGIAGCADEVSRDIETEARRCVGSRGPRDICASNPPTVLAGLIKEESVCAADVEEATRGNDAEPPQHREAEARVLTMQGLVGDVVVVATKDPAGEVRSVEQRAGFVLEGQGIQVREAASRALDVAVAADCEQAP
jgi:hypothetical protein